MSPDLIQELRDRLDGITPGSLREDIRALLDALTTKDAALAEARAELERAYRIIENCAVQITMLHGLDPVAIDARAFLAARALQDEAGKK
jgi:hypothetical protein